MQLGDEDKFYHLHMNHIHFQSVNRTSFRCNYTIFNDGFQTFRILNLQIRSLILAHIFL